MNCPLCESTETYYFVRDDLREYFRCKQCDLTYVPQEYHLDPATEKSRYDCHENSPSDPEYRKFLSRLFDPLSHKLKPQSRGLDFGCGPGPTLSVMFEEKGHRMGLYDLFYYPHEEVLDVEYDFITATEVFEHLFRPGKTLNRLVGCLSEKGILGVMTRFAPQSEKDFLNWHYKNDDTHVSFFSKRTFEYLSSFWNMRVEFLGEDTTLLTKQA